MFVLLLFCANFAVFKVFGRLAPFFAACCFAFCFTFGYRFNFMDYNSLVSTKHHARYALMTMYFFSGFVFATLFSRLPAIQQIYSFDYAHLGLPQLCMSVGSLLCMPVCANLANKYGSNRLTMMGYMVAFVFVLLPIMPSQFLLFPVCMAYGVFASLFDIAINGNSILVEKAYKRSILAKFHAIYYVGTCVGALVAIVFISFQLDASVHFSVASSLVVCELGFLRPFLMREKPKRENKAQGFHFMFPKGLLLFIAFIALFSRVIEGVVSSWSTQYMNQVIVLPENFAPVGLAVYAAFMAVGRFMGDSLRARYSEPFILMACSLTAMLGLALMVSSTNFYLSVSGLLVTGLGMSCLVPVIYSLSGSQPDVSPGTGIAMVNTISGTGFLFGPFMVGLIANAFGLRVSFFYVLMLGVCMFALSFIFWRIKGKNVEK